MRHRITVTSNPRILVLLVLMIAFPAAGVLLLVFAGTIVGVLALAGAAYLDYRMLLFLRSHLQSWVETTDTELTFRMPDGELLHFPWNQVVAAGYCTQERGRPFLFVYRGEGDKLVTIPQEYSDFRALYGQIEQRSPFETLSLKAGETIQERLKEKLQIEAAEDGEGPP